LGRLLRSAAAPLLAEALTGLARFALGQDAVAVQVGLREALECLLQPLVRLGRRFGGKGI